MSWSVLAALTVGSWLLDQYGLAAVSVIAAGFVLWTTRFSPAMRAKAIYRTNHLLRSHWELEIRGDSLFVEVGGNAMQLSAAYLRLIKLPDWFYLTHKVGFSVFVPIDSLSHEERSWLTSAMEQPKA